jgi:hypothetical protein
MTHQFLLLKKCTYREERENKGSLVMSRVMHFSEKNCESESLYFIPICLPDRQSFQHHHTPVDNCVKSWCRILFQNLFVFQISKEKPAFFREPNFSLLSTQSPPLDPSLRQPNPVRPIDPYLPKIHPKVIFPP